jgi:hypothetical protein
MRKRRGRTLVRPPTKERDERQPEEQELDVVWIQVDRAGFSEDFLSDSARKKWRRLERMK